MTLNHMSVSVMKVFMICSDYKNNYEEVFE